MALMTIIAAKASAVCDFLAVALAITGWFINDHSFRSILISICLSILVVFLAGSSLGLIGATIDTI